jgi:hypothetical protein
VIIMGEKQHSHTERGGIGRCGWVGVSQWVGLAWLCLCLSVSVCVSCHSAREVMS